MRYYNYQVYYYIRGLKEPILAQSRDLYPAYLKEKETFIYNGKEYYIFSFTREILKDGIKISVYLEANLKEQASTNGVF